MSGRRRTVRVRSTAARSIVGSSRVLLCLLAVAAAALGGCSIYRPKPLPWQPSLAAAPTVTVPARDLGGVPGLRPEPIDPAKGLTETNVAALAVLGNPRLRAVRRQEGVARAQLFAAGLLPDPVLSGGITKSPFFTGYGAALTEAVRTLITHGASKAAAKANAQRVHLDVVWQEWQVAARARELYVEARTLRHLRAALGTRRRDLGRLYRRDLAALARHEMTAPQAATDLAAWNAAEGDWRALELRENANRHALDGLLGLEPSVRLRLRRITRAPVIDDAQYRSALAQLPRRRPDLLALRAGYRSQEQRLREAILGQFPLLGVGVDKTRSAEEGIQSIGFNVSLTLPIFNRNRGPIAIGRASRAYLHQAYQARLDETVSQVDEIRGAAAIMRRELAHLESRRTARREAAAAARRDLHRGTFSLSDYARVQSGVLSIEAQVIELGASLEQTQAALATLLALPF